MTGYVRMAEHLRLPSTTATWPPNAPPALHVGCAHQPRPCRLRDQRLAVSIQDLDATCKLGGENYVLWGGREGYETLLNRCIGPALDPIGRFMNRVVE